MRTVMLATLLLLGAAPLAAQAAPRQLSEQQLQQVELSLKLTGRIEVDAQGRVSAVDLQPNTHAGAHVESFVRQQVASWEFEPRLVDDVPSAFSSDMSLRLVGKPSEDGGMNVRIVSAHFDAGDLRPEDDIKRKSLPAPVYPREMFSRGMTGIVYLLLNINANGEVADAAVEQVNLTRIGNERQMHQARTGLGKASLQAARRWTFEVPQAARDKGLDRWHVRVPVAFNISDRTGEQRRDGSRGWEAYIPGPREPIAWLAEGNGGNDAGLEAMDAGKLYLVDNNGPKLKTPLQG